MFKAALEWLAMHGKESLETIALVAGLCFSGASFRADARERKISNLMALANSHRDLWTKIDERPDLERIMMNNVDVSKYPVTKSEKTFVHLLITHFAVSFEAMKLGMVSNITGLKKDATAFFSLPIPNQVWTWSKEFQAPDLVEFVEKCLTEKSPSKSSRLSTGKKGRA